MKSHSESPKGTDFVAEINRIVEEGHAKLGHVRHPVHGYQKKLPRTVNKPANTPEMMEEVHQKILLVRKNLDSTLIIETAKAINWLRKTNVCHLFDMDWKTFCAVMFGCTKRYVDRIGQSGHALLEMRGDESMSKWVGSGDGLPIAYPVLHSIEGGVAFSRIPRKQRPEAMARAEKTHGNKATAKTIGFIAKQMKAEAKSEKSFKLAGNVRTAIEAGDAIRGYCRAIGVACTGLAAMMEGPFGVHMPAGQPTDKIRTLSASILAAAPYSDCPYCSEGKIASCRACKGHCWVTRSVFASAPPDARSKSKLMGSDE